MPKRTALPADLPRVDCHHEPENTRCACGCALKRIVSVQSAHLDSCEKQRMLFST